MGPESPFCLDADGGDDATDTSEVRRGNALFAGGDA